MPSDRQVSDFLNNPVNFLYAADWREGVFRFVPAGRSALSTLSFLDNRTLGTSRRQGALAIDQVQKLAGPFRGSCDFIFHSAFCCSTLIARCLDIPGQVLSLKEPLAILNLSGLLRAKGSKDFKALAATTFHLLARPLVKGERVLIKPSNGANNLLPEILSVPGCGKVLLLYGPLEDFLVAVLTGGKDRQDFIDGTLRLFRQDFATGPELPPDEELDPLSRAALAWGLQLRRFGEVSETAGNGRVRTLNVENFLADIPAGLSALSDFFGYGFSAEDISGVLSGPVLGTHAKESHRAFSPAERIAEGARTLKTHREEINEATAFLTGLGLADPVLNNPLVP